MPYPQDTDHRIIFTKGASVKTPVDKENVEEHKRVLHEYTGIVQNIPDDSYVCYTDGSQQQKGDKKGSCGSGFTTVLRARAFLARLTCRCYLVCMASSLTLEQKRSLYRDGYIIVRNGVSSGFIEAARRRIRAAKKGENLGGEKEMTDLLNASSIAPILTEAMGSFDPPVMGQVGVVKRTTPDC